MPGLQRLQGMCRKLAGLVSPAVLWALGGAYLVAAIALFASAGGAAATPPDLLYHYDADTLHELLRQMGEAGRSRYVVTATTLDVLYPVVYSLFLAAALARLLDGVSGRGSLLPLAPFAIGLADLAENAAVVAVVTAYPERRPLLEGLAGWLTSVKWSLAVLVVAALLVLLARQAGRVLRARSGRNR